MNPRLAVQGLTTTFVSGGREVHAVRGVDLQIEPSRTLVLLGESGSGKSVTARSILRLYGSAARIGGTVLLDGQDLLSLRESQMRTIRGATIGLVPQDPSGSLDPLRSIGSQLAEVLRSHHLTDSRANTRRRCIELLTTVGIPDPPRVLHSRPHELSGGMRQRVTIAMAVAGEPQLLIADEPTTALDVTVQAQVLELFTELQRSMGMSLLMVTHDVGVAEELDGDVAVMYAGVIVERGRAREVLATPRHPYTAGLLSSLPSPRAPRGGLTVIGGRPPLTGEVADGCAFAPRCVDATTTCRIVEPTLVSVASGHSAACPVSNPESPSEREELTA